MIKIRGCPSGLFVAVCLCGAGGFSLEAQPVSIATSLPKVSDVKIDNGVFVHYLDYEVTDPGVPSVEVLDRDGVLRCAISVLAAFPEAKSVRIEDVSAYPGQGVAVAAVFSPAILAPVESSPSPRERPGLHGAALLYYDWHGALTKAVGLDPSREIERLELTQEGTVWALLDGAGDRNPRRSPVVVVFQGEQVVKSFFNWIDFPAHAYMIHEGPESNGVPAFGVTESKVWFWLPGYDLVIFDHDGGNVRHVSVNIPGFHKLPIVGTTPLGQPSLFFDKWHLTEDGKVLALILSRQQEFPSGVYSFDRSGKPRFLFSEALPLHVSGFDGSDVVSVTQDPAGKQIILSRRRYE